MATAGGVPTGTIIEEAEVDRLMRDRGYYPVWDSGTFKIWANEEPPAPAPRAVTIPHGISGDQLDGLLRAKGLPSWSDSGTEPPDPRP